MIVSLRYGSTEQKISVQYSILPSFGGTEQFSRWRGSNVSTNRHLTGSPKPIVAHLIQWFEIYLGIVHHYIERVDTSK